MINNNLLPSSYRRGPIREMIQLLVLLLLISLMLFTAIFGSFYFMKMNLEKKIDEYDIRIEETKRELDAITRSVQEHEFYEEVIERVSKDGQMVLEALYKEFDLSKFMYEIVKTLDTQVLFFYADINESGFVLKGQALEYKDAETFYADFKKKVPDFYHGAHIELKEIEVVPTTEEGNYAIKEVVIFAIEAQIDEKALEQAEEQTGGQSEASGNEDPEENEDEEDAENTAEKDNDENEANNENDLEEEVAAVAE